MRIQPVAIPVLGFPVVPLDRGEMAVSLGCGLTGRGRTIPFIPIDRPLCGADMPQALSIRQIGRCRRHFVNQAGLHIHTDMLFIAVPILLLAFAANPGLLIHCHLREHFIVQLLNLLLARLIPFFPQRRFRNQMRGIHKGEHFTHQAGRFELLAHRRKQLRESSRPNASADAREEAVIRRGLGHGEPTKPFGGQIFFQIPFHFSIRKVFHELQQQTAKQALDPIAVGSFELPHVRKGLRVGPPRNPRPPHTIWPGWASMVLGPFAETKGPRPRRAETRPRLSLSRDHYPNS